jgi:hypothetical protein
LLLLLLWDCAFQGAGFSLAALRQRLALYGFFGFWRGSVSGLYRKGTGKEQRQAQCWQCRTVVKGHR